MANKKKLLKGGGGGIIDPLTITGMTLWLKADAGAYVDNYVTLATNTQTVQGWLCQKTGATGQFDQTVNSAFRPQFLTNIIDGKPVLRFDGTDDYMLGAVTSTYITASAYTVFVVAKAIVIDTNNATVYDNDPIYEDEDGDFALLLKSTPTAHLFNWDVTPGDSIELSIATGTFYLFEGRHGGGNLGFRLNGGTESTVASGDTVLAAGSNVRLGTNAARYANIDIAEMMIFNVDLSSGDKTSLRAYFDGRFPSIGIP